MSVSFSLQKNKPLRDDNVLLRGYRMIHSVNIQNFRCFDSVNLVDCPRINLIVGRNASGKTAFLEALFLASGASPELAIRLKNWRGQPAISVSAEQTAYEGQWKDLFHNFNQKQEISIQFHGSSGFGRSLKILYVPKTVITVPISADTGTAAKGIVPLTFIYRGEDNREYQSSMDVTSSGLQMEAIALPPIHAHFFGSQIPLNPQQYANLFSDLSIQKKQSEIVDALREEFHFIEDIGVEAGDLLYASVEHLSDKVQVGVLSAGIYKLLCILLLIGRPSMGIILIDEIENGFYYDMLPSIWRLILQFAKKYEVQVFASTHSRECLEAAADVAKEQSKEFGVIRAVKANGVAELRQFDGKRLVDAINEGIEIR